MGTDIHPAIEVRRNGVWRFYRPKEPCRWYHEVWTASDIANVNSHNPEYAKTLKVGDRKYAWDRCKTRIPDFFSDRNYRVFAVLGNVRNGVGFAGVYTHDTLPYIQDNRGLPDDLDPKTYAKLSHEHSDGWVTLAELKDFDYDQTFTEGGVIEEQEFLKMCHTGETPETWSGWISGPGITILEPDQYAALYRSPIDLLSTGNQEGRLTLYDTSARYYINAKWKAKLRSEVADIPDQWIPYLERLVPKGGTDDDVRVVFDFDS